MYEAQTQEVILKRMLERVPAKFDKREGSIIFDATAPASVELQNFYISLDIVLSEVFADTASREYLIKRCAERGITPYEASHVLVLGKFTPSTVEVEIGSRFSHEDYNYIVTEKVSDGYYHLKCETIGSEPNGVTGQLIPISYVENLQTAQITEVVVLGEDEESTDSLRARYMSSLQSEAFGGNTLDYKNKVLSIEGVGGVKVYRAAEWNGGGTVKLVIVDSEYGIPTDELVDIVQTEIDPVTNQGEGDGLAPIGHFVTVVGAYNTSVNIETNILYKSGHNWSTEKSKIRDVIDKYLNGLNGKWQDLDKIIVRIAGIENAIWGLESVIDVYDTKLNGKAENLSIDKDSIVTRGTINEE